MGQSLGGNMFPNHLGQNGMGSGLGGGYGSQGLPGQGLFYPPQNPRGMGNIAPRGPSFANTIKVDVQVCSPTTSDAIHLFVTPADTVIHQSLRAL
jgi:hypothetical protein